MIGAIGLITIQPNRLPIRIMHRGIKGARHHQGSQRRNTFSGLEIPRFQLMIDFDRMILDPAGFGDGADRQRKLLHG